MINRFEHLVTFYKNLVVSILWIAFISGSYGSLTVLPKNTAVVTGSQVRFLCTSSLPYPTWSWRSSNIPQPLVSGSCTLAITANSQIFGVDSTPPGSCNLIINSTSSENGAYTCGDADQIAPNTGIAVLTVLDSGPICIMNATNSTVFNSSSNILQMECHVSYSTYYNYSIEPRLAWSRTSPPPSYPNSTFAFSVLSTRLAIPETSSETCTLGFVPSTNPPPNHNTDAPSFTSNCNTPVIYPLYCPMNVTITGASDDGSIDNGAQLHCSASANPSASYQWYFITSTSVGVVINETISVTATGNYTCKATNIINGGNCTAYTIQEITIIIAANTTLSANHWTSAAGSPTASLFHDDNTTDEVVTTTTPPDNPSHTVAIILGIVIPLSIGIIVAVVVVIWMRHKNSENTKPTQPLINGSEQQDNQFGTIASSEYTRVNKSASSRNRQDIHVKDGNQMIYGQLNIADTRRRKPIQSLIEDRPFPYSTIVRA